MGRVKVTQVKSKIDRSKKQKATLEALGLRRMHQSVEHTLNPQVEGMIAKVAHLVKVENI